jgi:predicted DsbA family dithiol-disulfide isomerase
MTTTERDAPPVSLVIVSDFVWPWCYIGLVEVERLRQAYDLDIQFAPYLLDPSTPSEGKPRRQATLPGDPPTPIEQRAADLGITFTRGRTWTSNSHLALEAAAFAEEHGDPIPFHRAMFRAYFEELADIGEIETVVRIGAENGLAEVELREALVTRRYRDEVDEGICWARGIGVTAVPTFVLDGQYGIVGAQDAAVFEDLLQRKLGRSPRRWPAGTAQTSPVGWTVPPSARAGRLWSGLYHFVTEYIQMI